MNQSELQSSVATDSGPEHLLSEYGTQTPLAVTEALTLQSSTFELQFSSIYIKKTFIFFQFNLNCTFAISV